MVKPMIPDTESQSQAWAEASSGKGRPRAIQQKTARKTSAITSRIKLTDMEPTFLPADSKDMDVIVQQKAVLRAASSPMWENGIY